MRNRIPFGYTPFGGVILVKLNSKISFEQGEQLKQKYPNIIHWNNGKYGTAIEGSILYTQMESFIRDFSALKLDAKIERLIEQKVALLDSFITDNTPNLEDLEHEGAMFPLKLMLAGFIIFTLVLVLYRISH
jgi:hypothetical protein